jgi:outer membrane protein assembly factor BamB
MQDPEMSYLKHLLLVPLIMVLASCSVFRSDENLNEPVDLQRVDSQIEVDRLWRHDVGSGPDEIHPSVYPAIDGDQMFVGDRSGQVTAIDLTTGRRLWQEELDDVEITGATGAGGNLVLVGTNEGDVIALSQEDGSELWRTRVTSEVLAAPATNGNVVIVLSIDGKIRGLDASDGSQLWLSASTLPLLSVRGNAPPLIVDSLPGVNFAGLQVVFVAQDNGKVSAFSVSDGIQIWDARVAVPEGQTDLERMVDIDGIPLYHSGRLYAVSYQGGLMAINPTNGQPVWFQDASSTVGPSAFAGSLVITEADGTVRAFNATDGTEFWSTDEYAYRSLNQSVTTSSYVAFADYEGYLHFLSRRSGETVGRVRVDRSGVRSPTMLYNDQFIVLGNSGNISAYSVTELD